jgi:hypothetical protein
MAQAVEGVMSGPAGTEFYQVLGDDLLSEAAKMETCAIIADVLARAALEEATVQPRLSGERLKSFDPLASINMLRYDVETFGYVLDETRRRVRDEQLSYLVEGCDRASCTTFVFRREDDDLIHFDRGEWSSYRDMLKRGLDTAELEAEADPRRQFLADWARDDFIPFEEMCELQPGEQYCWFRSFPHEEMERSDAAFLRSVGLQPDREMGFLYRASCREDGFIVLQSQTVDRSDYDAFAAAMRAAQDNPNTSLEELTIAYDSELIHKYGGYFYVGRRDAELRENAWEQVLANRDLIEYLSDGLEEIARQPFSPELLEEYSKRHIYGVWALFKRRLDGEAAIPQMLLEPGSSAYQAHRAWLAREVQYSFRQFARQGRVLIGCGGALSILAGESDILNASTEDVFSAIFGSQETAGSAGAGETCVYVHDGCYCCGLNSDGTSRASKMKVRARRDESGVARCLRKGCNAWLSSDGKDGYIGDIARKAQELQTRSNDDYELQA